MEELTKLIIITKKAGWLFSLDVTTNHIKDDGVMVAMDWLAYQFVSSCGNYEHSFHLSMEGSELIHDYQVLPLLRFLIDISDEFGQRMQVASRGVLTFGGLYIVPSEKNIEFTLEVFAPTKKGSHRKELFKRTIAKC